MLEGTNLIRSLRGDASPVCLRMAEYCVPAPRMTSVAALTGSKYHLPHRWSTIEVAKPPVK